MEVTTFGFLGESDADRFLSQVCLREWGIRQLGDRIYIDIYAPIDYDFYMKAADFVLDEFKLGIVERYLDREYGFLSGAEKKAILKAALSEKFFEVARPKIEELLCECLNESRLLDVEGFISFRLKRFAEVVFRRVDAAAEEIIAVREYDEFVGLLRYIFRNSAKCGALNVEFSEGAVQMDDGGEKYDYPPFDGGFVENELLVGQLVKLAPEKITIRGAEFCDEALISTIKDVFENAVFFE